jgi:hypothetical protein
MGITLKKVSALVASLVASGAMTLAIAGPASAATPTPDFWSNSELAGLAAQPPAPTITATATPVYAGDGVQLADGTTAIPGGEVATVSGSGFTPGSFVYSELDDNQSSANQPLVYSSNDLHADAHGQFSYTASLGGNSLCGHSVTAYAWDQGLDYWTSTTFQVAC